MLNSNTRRDVRQLVEAGYSIVEVVVAMGILAVSAVGVVYLLSQSTQSALNDNAKLGSSNACINHANTLLTRLKDQGLNLSAASYLPETGAGAAGTRNPETASGGCPDPILCPGNDSILSADRWQANGNYDVLGVSNAPNQATARPAHLILGIMNDLAAIYNSAPATYCGGGGGDYNGILAANNSFSSELTLTGQTLEVQPYNIETLALAGCPAAPLLIAPPSATTAPSNPATGNATTRMVSPGGMRSDLGFLVTLSVNYTDRSGNAKSCFVQQRFQYEREPNNFPIVTGTIDSDIEANQQSYTCDRTPTPAWAGGFNLQQTINLQKEGSIVLCRNRSRRRGVAPAPGTRNVVLNLRGYFHDTYVRDMAGGADAAAKTSYYIMGMTSNTMNINAASRVYCDPYFGCQHAPIVPTTNGDLNAGVASGTPAAPAGTAKAKSDYSIEGTNFTGLEVDYTQNNAEGGDINDNDAWVPCESITHLGSQIAPNATAGGYNCGGAGDSTIAVDFDPGGTGARDVQVNVTINTPGNIYGCDIAIDVAEVDAAYNISNAHGLGTPADFYTIEDYLEQPTRGLQICHNNTGATLSGGGASVPAGQYYFWCGQPGGGGRCPVDASDW